MKENMGRIVLRSLLLISLATVLAACSATGKQFGGLEKPESGYAHVYVYRPFTFKQSGIFPDIKLDSKLVGKLKNGGFLMIKAEPGDHKLAVTGNYLQWSHAPRTFDVSFEREGTYFYKLQPFVSGFYGPRRIGGVYLLNHSYSFVRIEDRNVALAELKTLRESVSQ